MTTLRARLALICGLLSIALIIVGGTGFFALKTVSDTYDHVVEINLPNAMLLQQMSSATGGSIRQIVRLGYPDLPEKEINYLSQRFEDYVKKYSENDKRYQDVPFVEGEAAIYDKVASSWTKTLESARKMIQLRKSGNVSEFHQMLDGDFREAYNSHGKSLEELITFQENQGIEWSKKAQGIMQFSRKTLLMISAIGLILGLSVAALIARLLQKNLKEIATSVAESKTNVENASEQLNMASQQLANNSTEAAASLEETVASLEELTSMVKMNSANASQANELSQGSQQRAVRGDEEINGLISAMGDINKSSKRIEEIISVIDDIAFQTNLLALNAAVEAARAGEQGKGFAVVAEAVRALAQRSAQAAKEISHLIKDSVEQVERGSSIADRSGLALKEIVSSVKKVTELNSEIATASSEQSEGIAQISKAMNQLDQATQSNAASAEEAAASSEVMLRQAKVLGEQVEQLQKIVG
ncbi:methyl-accepting chemotaxis protein [Bdellovibrio sp. HCB2-146]|uniref:methyl-accepting chemotaxis protein n=1 Tax=Bdellovibrio sp. HCB2-146 TaxID=3394362 RepID=UPI0039BC9C4A